MESLRLVSDWRCTLLRLQEPRPLTASADRSFSNLPNAVAACGATVPDSRHNFRTSASLAQAPAPSSCGSRPLHYVFSPRRLIATCCNAARLGCT